MKGKGIQVDAQDSGFLDVVTEPLRDGSGKIVQGLVVGDTLEQNKAFILMAQQGEFKANPNIGVGFGDILLGADLLEFRHKIREQFNLDGLKIKTLDLYHTDRINIDAYYES